MKTKHIVVIGGGFAGLATAALAARSGHQVTLFEKNDTLGGRARTFTKKSFSFDMGPSWYLMPEVFEHFFHHFNKKSQDFYDLKRLNPRYEVVYEDGQKLTLTDDLKENQKLFESIEPGAGKKLKEYLQLLEKTYSLALSLLYFDIFDRRNFFKWTFVSKGLTFFSSYNAMQSWHSLVTKYFKNMYLQKILEFPAVFLGGSPANTPALFALLSWADFGGGVWYPIGGMKKVVDAITSLAIDTGVQLRTNSDVTKIEVKDGQAVSVWIGDTMIPADAVVVASDLVYAETTLLERQYQSYPVEYWEKKTPAISAVCLYLGVKKRLPKTAHHLLYFTTEWNQHFENIFQDQKLPQNPSFYVSLRSMTDRKIVPKDSEELFVLIPTGTGEYSDTAVKKLADQVISKIEQVLGESFSESLVVNEIYTSTNFEQDYHAFRGSALGLAHTLTQSFWGRPGSQSLKVKGLYYAGQYTNPGVGVPMALISAELAVRRINDTV